MKKSIIMFVLGLFVSGVFLSVLQVSAGGEYTNKKIYNKLKSISSKISTVDDDVMFVNDNVVDSASDIWDLLVYVDTNAYYSCVSTAGLSYCADSGYSALSTELSEKIKKYRESINFNETVKKLEEERIKQ